MKADLRAACVVFWSASVQALLVGSAHPQVAWSPVVPDQPPGSYTLSMAHDEARARTVAFLVLQQTFAPTTWEFDGSRWSRAAAAVIPRTVEGSAMVYDAARGRVLLFGDGSSGALGETWDWDGTRWRQLQPIVSPSRRSGHRMAYDAARARVVLFGGKEPSAPLPRDDTWEWDGTNWTLRTPSHHPVFRQNHAMAYDSARQRVVLFGGEAAEGFSQGNDTWEWDGIDWTLRSVAGPTVRGGHALAFDRTLGRTVLFGGQTAFMATADTWLWDGTTWTRLALPAAPTARFRHAMAYDVARGRVVLFGGREQFGTGAAAAFPCSDTWEFDGQTWTESGHGVPHPRQRHELAFDAARGRAVLFGGYGSRFDDALGDTWEWDGTAWRRRHPAHSPTARGGHAMAYDPGGRRILLFGGREGFGSHHADLWQWDGTDWQLLTTPPGPAARQSHALTWDEHRGRLVLFGGQDPNRQPLADGWEWDGTAWRSLPPGPQASTDPVLMFDPIRGRSLLITGPFLWDWDGTVWTQLGNSPAQARPAVFDSRRRRIAQSAQLGGREMWEWEDGSGWQLRQPGSGPAPVFEAAMAYDSVRGLALLFGGMAANYATNGDTWRYGPTDPALYDSCAPGCAGSSGVPALAASPWRLPWIGDVFEMQVAGLSALATPILGLGFSRTSWGPVPLPLDLSPLGAPACWLSAAPEILMFAPAANGSARWQVPVCDCRDLIGSRFYTQVLVLDPGANRFGLALSNAQAGSVGAR